MLALVEDWSLPVKAETVPVVNKKESQKLNSFIFKQSTSKRPRGLWKSRLYLWKFLLSIFQGTRDWVGPWQVDDSLQMSDNSFNLIFKRRTTDFFYMAIKFSIPASQPQVLLIYSSLEKMMNPATGNTSLLLLSLLPVCPICTSLDTITPDQQLFLFRYFVHEDLERNKLWLS